MQMLGLQNFSKTWQKGIISCLENDNSQHNKGEHFTTVLLSRRGKSIMTTLILFSFYNSVCSKLLNLFF